MYTKEEKKQIRLSFWNSFENDSRLFFEKQGLRKKWILNKTGIKGLELKFDVDKKDAYVMLQISSKYVERRKRIYDLLFQYKPIIQEFTGDELNWEQEFENEYYVTICRVYFVLEGVSLYKKEDWEKINSFFIQKMSILELAFNEIKDILIEKLKEN